MKKNTVLIAGIVSNEARNLRSEIARLNKAIGSSSTIFWIIIESDSTDNTLEVLEQMKKRYTNFEYQSLGNLKKLIPIRTERLAFCRNKYLDYMREIQRKENIEYLIVSDFDKTNSRLTTKHIENCLQLEQDWSAIFASQKYFYYDLWAFRHSKLCPYDIHKKVSELMRMDITLRHIYFKEIIKRMYIISRKKGLLEVESAFGGLAIYKSKYINKNIKYVGLDSDGNEMCEHLSINIELSKNAPNLYINADLVNHNINDRVWQSLFRWFVYLIVPNFLALKIHNYQFQRQAKR